MVNQQKGVQQETAYNAVVVNAYVSPSLLIFSCFYDPFWVKNDIATGIIHYNCSFLLHSADLPSIYAW